MHNSGASGGKVFGVRHGVHDWSLPLQRWKSQMDLTHTSCELLQRRRRCYLKQIIPDLTFNLTPDQAAYPLLQATAQRVALQVFNCSNCWLLSWTQSSGLVLNKRVTRFCFLSLMQLNEAEVWKRPRWFSCHRTSSKILWIEFHLPHLTLKTPSVHRSTLTSTSIFFLWIKPSCFTFSQKSLGSIVTQCSPDLLMKPLDQGWPTNQRLALFPKGATVSVWSRGRPPLFRQIILEVNLIKNCWN